MLDSFAQFKNVLVPIRVTDVGRVTLKRFPHVLKAEAPMLVTEVGRDTKESDEQP